MTEAAVLPDHWTVLQQRFQTLNKVMTTKAAIAQDAERDCLDASTKPNSIATSLWPLSESRGIPCRFFLSSLS